MFRLSGQKPVIKGGHRPTGLLGRVTNHIAKCEEMKVCIILDLGAKVKSDDSKFLPVYDS